MRARASALSLAFLLLALPGEALAQDGGRLGAVLNRVGKAWSRGDAVTLISYAARAGLAFDLDGEEIGPLAHRQAAAVLRRVFEGRETVRLEQGLARVVGGSPPRAFGELNWTSRTHGTTIPERSTVFIALVYEGDEWRITHIRLMR